MGEQQTEETKMEAKFTQSARLLSQLVYSIRDGRKQARSQIEREKIKSKKKKAR